MPRREERPQVAADYEPRARARCRRARPANGPATLDRPPRRSSSSRDTVFRDDRRRTTVVCAGVVAAAARTYFFVPLLSGLLEWTFLFIFEEEQL